MISSPGLKTHCISVAADPSNLHESASPDDSGTSDDVSVSPNQKPSTEKPVPVHPRGWAGRFRPRADEVDDRRVAGLLAYHALIEIRSSAGEPRRQPETASTDQVLERIRFLADLAHNLPLVARPQGRWRPPRPALISRRDRAMQTRPMSWTWNTTGAPGREWMLRHIAQAGYRWTPPPPLPTPRKDAAAWNLRQRFRVLAGWPVRTPPGRQPLPRQARILKALDE